MLRFASYSDNRMKRIRYTGRHHYALVAFCWKRPDFSEQHIAKYTQIWTRKGTIMTLTPLTAISPVDGRYRRATEPLAEYFSEQALIRYRTMVEIAYFIALCELPLPQLIDFPKDQFSPLRQIAENFSAEDAERVKAIEKITNHDVKAVEYFLKEAFEKLGVSRFNEFIHFGLTSQDVTNTAVPLCMKAAWENFLYPAFDEVLSQIKQMAADWKAVVMLARTPGQPASPRLSGCARGNPAKFVL